ncbi:unannotated protein [freshwater metagenome]|uniref:Unannotated protein n=1 Tax=freshwater metagenome TaxID=449393 RepID=A0A6J6CKJ5_9ZZZZ
MGQKRLFSILILTALIITGCTRTSDSSAPSIDPAVVERIIANCTNLNAPELGEGKLCIDNGFGISNDDFAFTNWGRSLQADANVTVQTLVDLFGRSTVCTTGPENECVLRPATLQKLEEWNTALSGGRCEGLATLSTRFFMNLDHPSMFRTGASEVADLQRGDGSIDGALGYWWATQFLPEVADRAAASRQRTPLELVDDVIVGLANSTGYTVGMYFGTSGHAVTPFAVTHRDTHFVIHVYDNNFPGERREILIDTQTNIWTYANATTRIDGKKIDWEGTTGTLELTPMSARKGPFRCSFCTTASSTAPTVITLASRDTNAAGFLYITSRNGKIEATPTQMTNTIPGATYVIGKGATGGLATVTLPADVGDFDVEVRRVSPDVPAADVVLGIQRPGDGLVQVSGDLAHTVVSATRSSTSLLAVRSDNTTIRAPSQNVARVSVAAGSALSRRTLAAGEQMTVSRIAENSIEVSLKGSRGEDFGRLPIAVNPDARTREIDLIVNQDGKLAPNNSLLAPVQIAPSAVFSFNPRAVPLPSRPIPSSTIPSIEVSEPD